MHEYFLQEAETIGYAQYNNHSQLISQTFNVLRSFGDSATHHFAFSIAEKYDSIRSYSYLTHLGNGFNDLEVVYSNKANQFEIYDFGKLSFDPSRIAGRIAHLGYMGPSDEDKHFTKLRYAEKYFADTGDEENTYKPVIVANQVLMILDNLSME